MGIIRKTMSTSTLGLVDFRSDKERTARNTKQTRNAIRAQSKQQAEIAAQQAHAAYQQAAFAQQQVNLAAAQLAATHNPPIPVAPQPQQIPAGWYQQPGDQPGLMRWFDGVNWTEHTQPLPLPPGQH